MNKEEIGTNAGLVWQTLSKHGMMSLEELQHLTALTIEAAASAVGWLAREDKICFNEQNGVTALYVYQEKYY